MNLIRRLPAEPLDQPSCGRAWRRVDTVDRVEGVIERCDVGHIELDQSRPLALNRQEIDERIIACIKSGNDTGLRPPRPGI